MDLKELKNKLAKNLEKSLSNWDYETAEISLKYWEIHIKYYGSSNIEKFCKLKNEYIEAIGVQV